MAAINFSLWEESVFLNHPNISKLRKGSLQKILVKIEILAHPVLGSHFHPLYLNFADEILPKSKQKITIPSIF